jgi:hypothetical protein
VRDQSLVKVRYWKISTADRASPATLCAKLFGACSELPGYRKYQHSHTAGYAQHSNSRLLSSKPVACRASPPAPNLILFLTRPYESFLSGAVCVCAFIRALSSRAGVVHLLLPGLTFMDYYAIFYSLEEMHRQRQAGKPLFSLGHLFATPASLELLERHAVNPSTLRSRHQYGDWGDLGAGDKNANDQALIDGNRVLSAYVIGGEQLYLLTEPVNEETGQRRSTCLMLAREY